MIKTTNKIATKRLKAAIKPKVLNKRRRYNTLWQKPGGYGIVQLILSTIGLFEFGNFVGYIKGRIFEGGLRFFLSPTVDKI